MFAFDALPFTGVHFSSFPSYELEYTLARFFTTEILEYLILSMPDAQAWRILKRRDPGLCIVSGTLWAVQKLLPPIEPKLFVTAQRYCKSSIGKECLPSRQKSITGRLRAIEFSGSDCQWAVLRHCQQHSKHIQSFARGTMTLLPLLCYKKIKCRRSAERTIPSGKFLKPLNWATSVFLLSNSVHLARMNNNAHYTTSCLNTHLELAIACPQ